MKKLINFMVLIFFANSLQRCTPVPANTAQRVIKIQPKFDYAPKGISKVGSSNITIALVHPIYGDEHMVMSPFEDMRKSMGNDFEELLTAKGFKIRGPFNQFGEMLYNDKLNSDFVFSVDIDLSFKNVDRKVKTISKTNYASLLGTSRAPLYTYSYMYLGEGNVICNLSITAKSTNFSEKLWKKNISLSAIPFNYVGVNNWDSNSYSFYDEVLQDNVVYNAVAKVLENQYQAIFELVEKQIEVDEMKMVSIEAKKVDKKL